MPPEQLDHYLKWLEYQVRLRTFCRLPLPLAYAAGRARARQETREATLCNKRLVFPDLQETALRRMVTEFFSAPGWMRWKPISCR